MGKAVVSLPPAFHHRAVQRLDEETNGKSTSAAAPDPATKAERTGWYRAAYRKVIRPAQIAEKITEMTRSTKAMVVTQPNMAIALWFFVRS